MTESESFLLNLKNDLMHRMKQYKISYYKNDHMYPPAKLNPYIKIIRKKKSFIFQWTIDIRPSKAGGSDFRLCLSWLEPEFFDICDPNFSIDVLIDKMNQSYKYDYPKAIR